MPATYTKTRFQILQKLNEYSIQFNSIHKSFIATQSIAFYIQTQDMVHNNFIK